MQTRAIGDDAKLSAVEEAGEEADGEKDGQRSVMDVLVDARWLSLMPAQAARVRTSCNRPISSLQ